MSLTPNQTGAYSIVGTTGTMAAGLAGGAPIFSFLWTPAVNTSARAYIDAIGMSMMSLGTGFAAGSGLFQVFVARSFTAADTGGTTLTITGDEAKRETRMPTTQLAEARISTTATLTAGTRTLDTQACGSVQFGVTTAVNTVHLTSSYLWLPVPDADPLSLATAEGFVIQATVPATGTWRGIISVDWREMSL